MKRKLLSLLLCAACVGTLLTGCQMTDSTEGASAAAEPESTAEGESAGTENGVEEASAGDAVKLDLYIDFTCTRRTAGQESYRKRLQKKAVWLLM